MTVVLKDKVEGSKGCFPAYAEVTMSDGSKRKISEVKIGEKIICFDESGKLYNGSVTKVIEHASDKILQITYWGGKIKVTPAHWMLNQFGTFAAAGSLQVDDALVDENGHIRPIKKIETMGTAKVYNLNVEPHATFICDGIRVHNGGTGLATLEEHVTGEKGGGKGKGGSTYVPREAPNTLKSVTIARVLDVLGEGEIEGLLDGHKSIFFNETRLQNEDGTYNFNGVVIHERMGTPNQNYVTGFPAIETEFSVGVEFRTATPVVRTITDENATAVSVKVRLPGLTKQEKNGDLNGSSVQFRISRQSNGGGYVTMLSPTISGKTTSAYEATYRIPLDEGGAPWDIKLERISADSQTNAQLNNQTYWSTYTKIIDNKIRYVDTALIGVEIDAEQFSEQVPNRAYEIKGLKIKVPVNYDPETRIYTGLWNGTFQTVWSNNPAWVLYDLLTNKRYGVGMSLDVTQIDKFAFYEIAKYCDELVSDGFGGFEPRYTFNGVINTQEEAYKVLNSIASNFRGMIYFASGLVTASADKPDTKRRIITPANTINGIINYQGDSLKSKSSVAVVRWNDPEDGYKSSVIAYEDPDLIQSIGWKPKEIIAYGCTSKGQAYRQGKWFIDTEKNAREMATWSASFDNADLRPGQIVAIADPSYAGARYGGRILAGAETNQVTIDQGVVLSVGETYSLAIILPDGSLQEVPIANTPDNGSHNVLDLAENLRLAPQAGAMWTISSTQLEPREFKVVRINETAKNIFEITAVIHDSTKYARVEENIDLSKPVFSLLPSGKLKPPSGLSAVETLYVGVNSEVKSKTIISWTPSPDARVSIYKLDYKKPNVDFYESLVVTTESSFELNDVVVGEYTFRVVGFDPYGQFTSAHEESFNLLGVTAPPSDVETFRINNVGQQSQLMWKHVDDLDLDYYIIKYSSKVEDAKWGESITLVERVPAGATTCTVPTLIGTYLIKAMDKSGNASTNATVIISNIGDINQNNIVEVLDEAATWGGTMDNVEVVTDALRLMDVSEIGYYYHEYDIHFGEVYTARVVPNLSAAGDDTADTIDKWITLAAVSAMSNADPSSWSVRIQISITQDGTTWGAYEDLIIGDYTCEGMRFRTVLESLDGSTTPVIIELGETVDMPDRNEGEVDVTTELDGTYEFVYAYPFKVPPRLLINAQDMASGDKYDYIYKNASGFKIRFRNSSNAAVVRTFDWNAGGYGRQL